MTPEVAFRVGFLARCAEEGLHGESLDARLDAAADFAKTANVAETIGRVVGMPFSALKNAGGLAALAGVVGGAGVGTAAGMLSAPEDPGKIKQPPYLKEVQKAELAAHLRNQAAELNRLHEAQAMAAAPTPMRSRFGI